MKICVIGAKGSGKTAIANAISGHWKAPPCPYSSTIGVRIHEFDRNIEDSEKLKVYLWDCSGDVRFKCCWPAMALNVDGVIMVYSIDAPKQKQELEKWYQEFCAANNLPNYACYIIAVNNNDKELHDSGMEGALASVQRTLISLHDPNICEKTFDVFASCLADILAHRSK